MLTKHVLWTRNGFYTWDKITHCNTEFVIILNNNTHCNTKNLNVHFYLFQSQEEFQNNLSVVDCIKQKSN